MEGKICIVTGANSGIGFETAKALAGKGAEVVMVCRSEDKGQAAREAIMAESKNDKVRLLIADMSSQKQVREVGTEIRDRYPEIDVLVNNAGTWISDLTYTEDGMETVLAVNHLAYFLMTHMLWPALESGGQGRVVNVASDSHMQVKKFDFEDPFLTKSYHGLRSYAQSKLANVMFTYELDRRKPVDHIVANAVQPGLVYTDIGLKRTTWLHAFAWKVRRTLWRGVSPAEGAETSIYLASSPEASDRSGLYWDNCKPKPSSDYTYQTEETARLWELSKEQCGVDDFFNP
ncbi:SDR family oxidoreductase [Flavilitoribacter nigricans]|uniref:Short-chain dehydrogenase n=1 Tax=Flavilitoribacter nigricans (strain ATCC 23147 / DSM 23189 / NBRC 102662 / NCIMB 1420 / SS-2) TaxID=1122177 RepID=A0A2D0MZ08_FLAN2|nr:SDR family oxidoreductase [Flavilitoribacter nigricans]PHN01410.1 short-chain dehydrogenase [Flavilitoribacter nigricans DSM 23189 = NBRC 102662]